MHKKTYWLTLLVSCFISSIAFTQQTISIQLVEIARKTPIAYGTLSIRAAGNTTKKQLYVTDSNGVSVLKITGLTLNIRASHVNYLEVDTVIQLGNHIPALISIFMSPLAKTAEEVTVLGSRKLIEPMAGGYIFNVEKKLADLSVNTTELLRHLPGMVQAQDGSLKLMGESIRLWIDGRPVIMSGEELKTYLRTMKAADIRSIKVYTTPPSWFDAAGANVVEIITSRNIREGLETIVDAGSGTRDKYNAGITLKYNNKAYSGMLRASFDHYTTEYSNEQFDQLNFNQPDSLYAYRNDTRIRNLVSRSFSFSTNHDFILKGKRTLGITARYNDYDRPAYTINSITSITHRNGSSSGVQDFERTNAGNNKIAFAGVSYRDVLDKKGSIMVADASYWHRRNRSSFDQQTFLYDEQGQHEGSEDIRKNNTRNDMDLFQAGALFLLYLKPSLQLRIGGKITLIDIDGQFRDSVALVPPSYMPDPQNSYYLRYRENIEATYVSLSGTYKKIQYTGGIRFEATSTTVQTDRDHDKSKNVNRYSNLFPTLSATWKISPSWSATLGLGRSIIRIQYPQLNPLNLRRSSMISYTGDPYLKPILQDALNLQINKTISPKQVMNFMLRFSSSKNSFLPILYADSLPGKYIERYTTYKGNTSLYMNLYYNGSLNSWLSFNASARLFNTWIRLKELGGYPDPPAKFTFGSNMGVIVSFWKNAALELKGQYQGRQVMVQGSGYENAYADLSFSKSFLNDALSVSFTLSDLFNSNNATTYSEYPVFRINTWSKDETRIASISVSYRFGKQRKNSIRAYQIQEEKRFAN